MSDRLLSQLDCDREGENIAFEVLECAAPFLRGHGRNGVFRARFSAIAESDIKRALDTLVAPNKAEALAVDARQEVRIFLSPNSQWLNFLLGTFSSLALSHISSLTALSSHLYQIDLKVGVAFTRHQTRHFLGKYADLDAALISYGPCQTPTLGFVVKRLDEQLSHVPKSFWSLQVRVMFPVLIESNLTQPSIVLLGSIRLSGSHRTLLPSLGLS